MSQKPPNSQPPLPSESGAKQSETNAENVTQAPPTPLNRTQPVFKTQLIKVLRGMIRALEGVVVKLEEPPATTEPSFFDKLQLAWSAVLAKIRSILPENLSSKLSNTGLTAIIAVILVVLLGTTSVLLRQKPTEVATVPSVEPEQPTTITPPLSEPEQPTTITPSLSEPEQPTTITPSLSEPEQPTTITPSPELITPPELTAPAEPKPVKITLPPEPVLTPEQNLIATIENQVAEITDRYADGLIQSIQANFEGSRLTIKVGDDWYTLDQSQQDKLANRMYERAKQLDFSRLEITDPQGTLIARSPVVGDNIVILKRQLLSQESGVKS